jgi:hypothetical protein
MEIRTEIMSAGEHAAQTEIGVRTLSTKMGVRTLPTKCDPRNAIQLRDKLS